MTIQRQSPALEEEFDLRRWIGALIHWKWVNLTLTVAAIATATIVNYLLLTPVYVTSGTTALPLASNVNGVGMTPLGYQGFALSNSVMDGLQQQLGPEFEATQLPGKYEFQLNGDNSLLSATASADTGEEAYLLVDRWLKTYNQEVSANIQNKFKSSISSSAVEVETLRAQLTEAQGDLDTLNQNNLIGGLEAQHSALEADLINSEEQLRLLIKSSIANDNQRLTLLQIYLDTDNQPPAGPATNISLVDESSVREEAVLERARSLTEVRLSTMERELASSEGRLRKLTWSQIPVTEASILALESVLDTVPLYLKETSDGSAIPNPVYLHFDQALSEARGTLASDVIEKDRLTLRISDSETELLALGKHLDTINTELNQIELESKFNTGHLEQFLQASIPSLKEELKQVGGRIDAARNERFRLDNALVQINEELQRANTRLSLLKAIEPDLVSFSTPTTAIGPQIPSSPTAPQRVRNILLFTILGSFLGFLSAIVAEIYRGRPVTSIPITE